MAPYDLGGTCKSEAVKAFNCVAKNINNLFGWVYGSIIKITTLTGATAYEIPNGDILHSQGYIYINKIKQNHKVSCRNQQILWLLMGSCI